MLAAWQIACLMASAGRRHASALCRRRRRLSLTGSRMQGLGHIQSLIASPCGRLHTGGNPCGERRTGSRSGRCPSRGHIHGLTLSLNRMLSHMPSRMLSHIGHLPMPRYGIQIRRPQGPRPGLRRGRSHGVCLHLHRRRRSRGLRRRRLRPRRRPLRARRLPGRRRLRLRRRRPRPVHPAWRTTRPPAAVQVS